jgi:hypothetical protein
VTRGVPQPLSQVAQASKQDFQPSW